MRCGDGGVEKAEFVGCWDWLLFWWLCEIAGLREVSGRVALWVLLRFGRGVVGGDKKHMLGLMFAGWCLGGEGAAKWVGDIITQVT